LFLIVGHSRNRSLACTEHYKELKKSERQIDYTYEAVAEAVWNSIYKPFFSLCKKRHKAEHILHSKKISQFSGVHPAHLGIKRQFWLSENQDPKNITLNAVEENCDPYLKAIRILRCLPQLKTPDKKLRCVVDCAQAVLKAVEKYWENRQPPGNITIGGDELVPLLTYVVIKANVPNIYTESCFMEYFIDEKSSMEEKGYLLATLQTCLGYICCLEEFAIQQCARELLAKENKKTQDKFYEAKNIKAVEEVVGAWISDFEEEQKSKEKEQQHTSIVA